MPSFKFIDNMRPKIFLNPCLIINFYFCLLQAADDAADTADKELMSKLFTVVFKCFKDADWGK